jgi:DNA-binding transcriptional LysR family regulator
LADRRQIDFTEIMREPFVGLLEAALEQHMAEHAKRRGVTLNHRVRLRSIRAIGEMIQADIGLAILPQSTAAELAGLKLCVLFWRDMLDLLPIKRQHAKWTFASAAVQICV